MNTKLVTLNVSTPSSIIEEKFSDYSIMKKIDYNNVKCDGLKHTHEIVAFIHKIETENSFVNLCEINPPNHLDVSSSLLELAKVEDNDNKNELAVYYNFLSEQIVMINTTFNKRVYPADSFTIACGLLLHNNSTSRYENIRKTLPFILLPDKRTLFDINKKAAIPQDCFFNEKKTAPHCNVLKKVAEVVSKMSKNKVLNEEPKAFKLVMAMHIDEVVIQSRHLFRNQTLSGPSTNEPDKLAK